MKITLLHPGTMGAALTAHAIKEGHQVFWVAEGRSARTNERAKEAGLTRCESATEALSATDVVLSVCPPHVAEDIAAMVARHDFTGTYLDANAISPHRMTRIADILSPGCTVVDGAIIGPPPSGGRSARLYLAGCAEPVQQIGELFTGTDVSVKTAGANLGSASALKMAFANFQKAARTLAGVSHALAAQHGVADLLTAEAEVMTSEILSAPDYLPSVAGRAWRWVPEMGEVASTLRAAGLPADMAEAAATVMQLWEQDKDQNDLPLADVLAHLTLGKPE